MAHPERDALRVDPLARNHVTLAGRPGRPVVVLAHGFGASQEMFAAVRAGFEPHHEVVLFDHVGAGSSDLSAYDARRHGSLAGYAEDLVEVLDALGRPPVHYVGHSAGVMIGVLAAGRRPDLFGTLSLIGASPRYLDDEDYRGGFGRADVDGLLDAMEDNYVGWSEATAPVVMGNPDRPELAEELARSFVRTQRHTALGFARAIFLGDHRDALAGVRTPTLVVQAAEDPMVPAEVGAYLHARIAGSELARLSATGHFPHVSGPEETTRVVRDFLDRHELDGYAHDRIAS